MGTRDVSATGLCLLLRSLVKAATELQDKNLELTKDNELLRAEIEALQRMRHAELEKKK